MASRDSERVLKNIGCHRGRGRGRGATARAHVSHTGAGLNAHPGGKPRHLVVAHNVDKRRFGQRGAKYQVTRSRQEILQSPFGTPALVDGAGPGALVTEAVGDALRRNHHLRSAHKDAVTAICVAADAVYSTGRDGLLRRWRPEQVVCSEPAAGSSCRFQLIPETAVPLDGECWCMTETGEWIFCGLSDGRIRAFSKSGNDVTLEGHAAGVSAILVHEGVLIAGSAEGAVRCWQMDTRAGTFVNSHTMHDGMPGQVRCIAVMCGALWVGGNNGIAVVELASLSRAVLLQPERKVVALLEFQAHMIAVYANGSALVFDVNGVSKHAQPPLAAGAVVSAMLSVATPDRGLRLLCGHAKGEISSIELPNFSLRCSWQAVDCTCQVRCLCSARHQGLFVVGAENGDLQLWQHGDTTVQSGSFGSPLAPLPSAPSVVVLARALEGAPKCAIGHICTAAPPSIGSSWRCRLCRTRGEGTRWVCTACQETYCHRCFPRYLPGESVGMDREAQVSEGRWTSVKKHSSMGCAVVTFKDPEHRSAVLALRTICLGGINLDLRPHQEKQPDGSRVEMPTAVFAGWKQDKEPGACRLLANTLKDYFDVFCDACVPAVELD